jgi:hypothetical protein
MTDQPSRTLLHILRSTLYLAWYYREREDGPMMRQLKIALGNAIRELEASGADRIAEPTPLAVSNSWLSRKRPADATRLVKTA